MNATTEHLRVDAVLADESHEREIATDPSDVQTRDPGAIEGAWTTVREVDKEGLRGR
jgi:hypothetical protein